MLKRIASLILAFGICALCFSGCGSKKLSNEEISAVTKSAIKKTQQLDNAKITVSNSIGYNYNNRSTTVKTTSAYAGINLNDENGFEMSEDTTVTTPASSSEYENYYKNGYYYTNRYNGNFKVKKSAKELGLSGYCPLIVFNYEDMKSVGVGDEKTSSGESGTVITFTPKNSVLKKYIAKALSEENSGFDNESINVSGSTGTYTVDKNGYLSHEKLTVNATVTIDGDTVATSLVSEISYTDIGKKVDPYDPEDSDYTEVDDLAPVAGIDNALSKTLSSDSLNMDMSSSGDITMDKQRQGYKRTYNRKYSLSNEQVYQQSTTDYTTANGKKSTSVSGMYYTDGTYYNRSDMYSHKIYSTMSFSEFYSGIFVSASTTPADIYSPGMMRNIKQQKNGDDTIYSFDVNTESDAGKNFFSALFGPYSEFGGDFGTAEINVKSFSGKTYVNKNGEYYKTEMSIKADIKFKEGSLSVSAAQTVKVSDIGKKISIKYPNFKEYTNMDKNDLLSASSSVSTNG